MTQEQLPIVLTGVSSGIGARTAQILSARGVPLMQGSCSEVYREKAFEGSGYAPPERLPVARELGETSLMFLTHPTLTGNDLDRICGAFEDAMREAAA